MTTNTKVALNELTENDTARLFENSKVWEKVTSEFSNDVSVMLNDFISELKGLGNYSINNSSDQYNCLYVDNPYYFLNSLKRACGYYAVVLSDEQLNKASELVSEYENSVNNDQQEKLTEDMFNLSNEYAEMLLDSMVAEYDAIYNKDDLKEYMQDELPEMYPDGAYYNREDNSIHYMIKD